MMMLLCPVSQKITQRVFRCLVSIFMIKSAFNVSRISELEELNEALVVERSNIQKDVHELKTDTDNLKLKVEPSEDIKIQEQSNVEEREMTPSSAFSTETSCADQETIGIDQVSSYFQPASQLFGVIKFSKSDFTILYTRHI